MSSNTYGRQVVLPLTNKSGGSVAAGDVVIIDTGNNDAFTTTTSAGFTGLVGVAQETIASNAVGRVLLAGYAALINVNASVTRGHFGATHTVAKQAASAGAARGTGTFCQFLTGGTTPDGVVYPVDLLGTSLTNPMNAVGDIIQGTTAGAPARLGAGTAGYVLTSAGAATPLVWAAPPAGTALVAGRVSLTSGDLTTTSATFVDATGVTVTLTTGAHRVLIAFAGMYSNSSNTAQTVFDVDVDGALLGGTHGLAGGLTPTANKLWNGSFTVMTVALTAASHTIKLQWRCDAGTATLYASAVAPASFSVIELAM